MPDPATVRELSKSTTAYTIFYWTYWMALAAILLVLVILLAKAFFSPANFSFWLQYVALATLVVCVVLLVGDLAGVVPMPESVRNGIMASFVIGVLTAATALVKQAWDNSALDNIDVLTSLLDEGTVSKVGDTWCPSSIVERRNTNFKEPPLRLFVATKVRGYRKNANQQPYLTGRAILTTRKGLSDIGQLPVTRSVDAWKARPIAHCPGLTADIIATKLGVVEDDILFIQYLEINQVVAGETFAAKEAIFRVEITDHNRQRATFETEPPITITTE
jgi:hypothetical protein